MPLNILNEKYESTVVNEIFDTVQSTMILAVVNTPLLGTEYILATEYIFIM